MSHFILNEATLPHVSGPQARDIHQFTQQFTRGLYASQGGTSPRTHAHTHARTHTHEGGLVCVPSCSPVAPVSPVCRHQQQVRRDGTDGTGRTGLTQTARCAGRRPSVRLPATKLAGHARARGTHRAGQPAAARGPPTSRSTSSAPAPPPAHRPPPDEPRDWRRASPAGPTPDDDPERRDAMVTYLSLIHPSSS